MPKGDNSHVDSDALFAKALQKANAKKLKYEKAFNVKLEVVSFAESQSTPVVPVQQQSRRKVVSSVSYDQAKSTSFGESQSFFSVTVNYKVYPVK